MRKLRKRKYSSTKNVKSVSDRSGAIFPYNEMVTEPGTGLWVHRSENDGQWNLTECFKDPIVPPDAQKIPVVREMPSSGTINTLDLIDASSGDPLYSDDRAEDTLLLYNIYF